MPHSCPQECCGNGRRMRIKVFVTSACHLMFFCIESVFLLLFIYCCCAFPLVWLSEYDFKVAPVILHALFYEILLPFSLCDMDTTFPSHRFQHVNPFKFHPMIYYLIGIQPITSKPMERSEWLAVFLNYKSPW